MAFKLVKVGTRRFAGKISDQVQIDVGSTGDTAFIVWVTYCGNPLPKPNAGPWQFTIAAGENTLSLGIEDPAVGGVVHVDEVADGEKQTLDTLYYNSLGSWQGYQIIGGN
jgi:hypothetical protein